MPDISMCTDKECSAATTCYRNEKSGTKPMPEYQSYMTPTEQYPDCEYYYTQSSPTLNNCNNKYAKVYEIRKDRFRAFCHDCRNKSSVYDNRDEAHEELMNKCNR